MKFIKKINFITFWGFFWKVTLKMKGKFWTCEVEVNKWQMWQMSQVEENEACLSLPCGRQKEFLLQNYTCISVL